MANVTRLVLNRIMDENITENKNSDDLSVVPKPKQQFTEDVNDKTEETKIQRLSLSQR